MANALVRVRNNIAAGVSQFRSPRALPQNQLAGGGTFNGNWWNRFFGLLPGAKRNYREEAGAAWLNTIVGAAVNWFGRNLPLAPPCVYWVKADGKEQIIPGHPLTELLKRPNKYYDGRTLRTATFLSLIAGRGNAYWWVKRANDGTPLELWYLPHYCTWPVWEVESDTDNWITGYAYRNRGETYLLPYDSVIHFRDGLDPYNLRSGLDPLGSAYREITADNEVGEYEVSLLKNMGVVPVIISPKGEGGGWEDGEAEGFKAQWIENTTGSNSAKPVLLDGSVDVNKIALSPKEFMLENASIRYESRILALIGLSPILLNLESGMKESTYSNKQEARKEAWQDAVIPRLELINSEIDTQLLKFFPGASTKRTGCDYSNVPALQEDQALMFQYLTTATGNKSWLLRNEARQIADLEPIPGWDEEDMMPAPDPLELAKASNPAPVSAPPAEEKPAIPAKKSYEEIVVNWRKRAKNGSAVH